MGRRVIVVGGYWKLAFHSRAEAETACKLFKRPPPPPLLTSSELQRNHVTAAERYPRGCFWHLYNIIHIVWKLSINAYIYLCLQCTLCLCTLPGFRKTKMMLLRKTYYTAQLVLLLIIIILSYTTAENMILCFTNYKRIRH